MLFFKSSNNVICQKQNLFLKAVDFLLVQFFMCTYYKLKLECLVILGGNGSQKTANLLREEGLNIVSLPKTIDNDLWGSDLTFGFHSAVDVATNAIDCIHTTAASHGRVFIVEIMGSFIGVFLAEPVSDILAATITAITFFSRFDKILDKGAGKV